MERRYEAAFMEVFQRYSGTLLAADEARRVVEGQWQRDKVVAMSFPDETSFCEWAESPDYQRLAPQSKSLARSNKTRTRAEATKIRRQQTR